MEELKKIQTDWKFFHITDWNVKWFSVAVEILVVPQKVKYSLSAAAAAAAKSLQSCPTLCNPMDCSPPGSPIPGILQARTLEWVAISFSNSLNMGQQFHFCIHAPKNWKRELKYLLVMSIIALFLTYKK